MRYEGTIIRPPSEAFSIILQVTVGCSYNKCTFCGAYKDVGFRVKSDEEIAGDLQFAAKNCTRQKRVFLADGDALILPQKKLTALLAKIRVSLPAARRVSLYANARAIRSKSTAELLELKQLGLDRIYLGFESGSDEVLKRVAKGETAESMIEAAGRVNASGLFLSVTTLLGLGGTELSEVHARKSAEILNQMKPKQIAALTLMPLPETVLGRQYAEGLFQLPGRRQILTELKTLVNSLTLDRVMFHANHASNYLPIEGILQKDKLKILDAVDSALAGTAALVPDYMRAL
jgi:radical SAM superfamily enzyme YgiQ (UPF0313 family)